MIVKFGRSCLSTKSKSVQREDKEIVYMLEQWDVQHELQEAIKTIEGEVYLYMDTQCYAEIPGVNFGYIDAESYTIIPQQPIKDGIDLLGRKFQESKSENKTFVYVGEYDEYGEDLD